MSGRGLAHAQVVIDNRVNEGVSLIPGTDKSVGIINPRNKWALTLVS